MRTLFKTVDYDNDRNDRRLKVTDKIKSKNNQQTIEFSNTGVVMLFYYFIYYLITSIYIAQQEPCAMSA